MTSLFRRTRDRTLANIRRDIGVDSLRNPSDLPPSVADVLPDGSSDWPVSVEVGQLLARAVLQLGRRNTLEFGAGSSSLIIARALAAVGGGRLTSIESAPEWCTEPWARITELDSVDARLIESLPKLRMTFTGPAFCFASAKRSLASRGPFDLVFIDAPQHFFGRDGAMSLVHPWLLPGALLVVDDAGREAERYAIARWLRTFPSLELMLLDESFGGRGVAVLRHTTPGEPRVNLWSWITSTIHLLRSRPGRIRHRNRDVPPLTRRSAK